eukprot:Pgem_evm1s8106
MSVRLPISKKFGVMVVELTKKVNSTVLKNEPFHLEYEHFRRFNINGYGKENYLNDDCVKNLSTPWWNLFFMRRPWVRFFLDAKDPLSNTWPSHKKEIPPR